MSDPTVLTASRSSQVATAVLLPLLGAVAGWAALVWHDTWLAQDWLPWRGPAVLVDRFAAWLGGAAPPVVVGLGVLAGLVLVLASLDEQVTVAVTDGQVDITRGSSRKRSSQRRFRREDVREALVDGRHLVLVAGDGTELARVRTELARARLAAAFRAHGYDWVGAAP